MSSGATSRANTPRQMVMDLLDAVTPNAGTLEPLLNAFREPWLNELIPGIKELHGCDQGTKFHLEGDAAVHTAFVVQNTSRATEERLGRPATFIERLAALLHDLKKPATRQPYPDGLVTFPNHEALGAKEVPGIGQRLGLTDIEIAELYFVVARHGDAHGFKTLSPSAQAELTSSPWKQSLAVIQEADARSCLMPDGSYLPVYWSELMESRT